MKSNDQKKGVNPVAAGIAGAAVAAAGMAAVALSDKDNRKKAEKILKDFKGKAENMRDKIMESMNKGMNSVDEVKEKEGMKVEETKKDIKKSVQTVKDKTEKAEK